MLIPADMPHPPGAVLMAEVFWDADGRSTEGPVPGGRGAIDFLDAAGNLLETWHVTIGEPSATQPETEGA